MRTIEYYSLMFIISITSNIRTFYSLWEVGIIFLSNYRHFLSIFSALDCAIRLKNFRLTWATKRKNFDGTMWRTYVSFNMAPSDSKWAHFQWVGKQKVTFSINFCLRNDFWFVLDRSILKLCKQFSYFFLMHHWKNYHIWVINIFSYIHDLFVFLLPTISQQYIQYYISRFFIIMRGNMYDADFPEIFSMMLWWFLICKHHYKRIWNEVSSVSYTKHFC